MQITLTIHGKKLTATIDDTPSGRDFYALLPMQLTLSDYNATEKVSDLPRKLDTSGASRGYKPSVGDIAYYAPWGNFVIFYRDFGYSTGLIKLGTINGDMTLLNEPAPFLIEIEPLP